MLGTLKDEVPPQVGKADENVIVGGWRHRLALPQHGGGGLSDQWLNPELKETYAKHVAPQQGSAGPPGF
jgi:hypothetical protein